MADQPARLTLTRHQQRLLDTSTAIRGAPPDRINFLHAVQCQCGIPYKNPGEGVLEWDRRQGEWLPTEKDRAYVATLQKAVREPAQIANWIARPARGIKGLPFEYEYVRLD